MSHSCSREDYGAEADSLFNRLPKTPFPPKTGSDDFDYESLVKSNVGLLWTLLSACMRLTRCQRELQKRIIDATEIVKSLTKELNDKRTAFEAEQEERDNLEEAARNVAADTSEPRYLLPLDETSQIKDLPCHVGLVQSDVT